MSIPCRVLSKSITAARSHASLWSRCFIALLAGWLGLVSSCQELQAGCSGLGGSPSKIIDSKPAVAGQLTLAMYVRYERGSLSFTLERPVRPCEGPSCSSKSTFEPTLFSLVAYRPMATQVAYSIHRYAAGGSSVESHDRPSSQFAPRGALEVCEPPPKHAS
jgi:hypothetical protein